MLFGSPVPSLHLLLHPGALPTITKFNNAQKLFANKNKKLIQKKKRGGTLPKKNEMIQKTEVNKVGKLADAES